MNLIFQFIIDFIAPTVVIPLLLVLLWSCDSTFQLFHFLNLCKGKASTQNLIHFLSTSKSGYRIMVEASPNQGLL